MSGRLRLQEQPPELSVASTDAVAGSIDESLKVGAPRSIHGGPAAAASAALAFELSPYGARRPGGRPTVEVPESPRPLYFPVGRVQCLHQAGLPLSLVDTKLEILR